MNQNFLAEYQPYIFVAIGLMALVLSVFLDSTKSKLRQTGILVEGIIFEQGFDNSSNRSFDNADSFIKDKITVRFVT